MPTEQDARRVLREYAGLDNEEAKALLKAIKAAAHEEILDTIAGSDTLPSAVLDLRALRLRRICEQLERLATQGEIQVAFRVAPTVAASIDRKMRASYPQAVDSFMRPTVEKSATVKAHGENPNARYIVSFDNATAFESARELLRRSGVTRDVKYRNASQTIDLPQRVEGYNGDPLAVLGLDAP